MLRFSFKIILLLTTITLWADNNGDGIILLTSGYTGTQDPQSRFKYFTKKLSEYDTKILEPAAYSHISMNIEGRCQFLSKSGFPYVNNVGSIHSAFALGLQSKDKNAIISFSFVSLIKDVFSISNGSVIADELRSVNRNIYLDVKPLVKIISLKDMSEYANADTVAIYELDLDKMGFRFMEQYNHCICFYLRKYGHPLLAPKVFINDTGYANKDKYVRDLLDIVHYGDGTTPLEAFEKDVRGSDFDFSEAKWDKSYSIEEHLSEMQPYYDELKSKWKVENDSIDRVIQ